MLEGVLTGEDNNILLDLAFDMAMWHTYVKLRMHTTYTIKSLWSQTKELGRQLRQYTNKLCPKYKTKPLPGEAAAAYRRKAAKKTKASPTSEPVDGLNVESNASNGPGFKQFNLKTYKIHALGNYVDHIEQFGPTDCFSTQQVSSTLLAINALLTAATDGTG